MVRCNIISFHSIYAVYRYITIVTEKIEECVSPELVILLSYVLSFKLFLKLNLSTKIDNPLNWLVFCYSKTSRNLSICLTSQKQSNISGSNWSFQIDIFFECKHLRKGCEMDGSINFIIIHGIPHLNNICRRINKMVKLLAFAIVF